MLSLKYSTYFKAFIYLVALNSCTTKIVDCTTLSYDGKLTYDSYKRLYTGTCNSFYLNGSLKSKRHYSNGLDHGQWEFYHENGNIETEGNFVRGKRNGVWKYYWKNGVLKQKSMYNLGTKTGRWEMYDSLGILQSATVFGMKKS